MKKYIFLLSGFLFVCSFTFSQKKVVKKPIPKKVSPSKSVGKGAKSAYDTKSDDSKTSAYGNNTKSNNSQRVSNVPYVHVASSGSGGMNDTVKVSLRNDNIIEKNLVKDRIPLVYEHLREDDAVYKQRIWREIDAREKINLAFRYSLVENNGSQRFISILINAIKGGVVAFNPDEDDRFTTPFTVEQALARFGSKIDTNAVYDLDGNITKYEIKAREVNLDSIYKYKIKEEVVFDKEASRLFTRILGIAPMKPLVLSDGTSTGQMITLFWIYYPDLRPVLARYEVYNPKNFGARMSWEDLFESRMFSSYITMSTIDNPFNQSLKEKYGKNSLFILLEGEAIKEKIFNYEQDLWSY